MRHPRPSLDFGLRPNRSSKSANYSWQLLTWVCLSWLLLALVLVKIPPQTFIQLLFGNNYLPVLAIFWSALASLGTLVWRHTRFSAAISCLPTLAIGLQLYQLNLSLSQMILMFSPVLIVSWLAWRADTA